jgi:hypothetical protein
VIGTAGRVAVSATVKIAKCSHRAIAETLAQYNAFGISSYPFFKTTERQENHIAQPRHLSTGATDTSRF